MEREQQIRVQLDHFDGPLALLLHLIQREEYSFEELDLNTITKQYLAYLNKMNELDFDVAGEYLYMASTLLYLKSKHCVDEEDAKRSKHQDENFPIQSKAELIERLEELARFQRMGERIWALPKLGEQVYTRPRLNRKKIIDSMTAPMELTKLTESMIEFLIKNYRKYKVVRRDRISIKEKLQTLIQVLKPGHKSQFTNLVDQQKGIDDVVITFISLLELARLKKIAIYQNEGIGEIYVDVVSELSAVDVESANGFEPEEANSIEEQEILEVQENPELQESKEGERLN